MCLAIPGKILSISGSEPLERSAMVSFGGIKKGVNLAFTPEAGMGNYVIVHVGFALSVVDKLEAKRVFEDIRQISAIAEKNDSINDRIFRRGCE